MYDCFSPRLGRVEMARGMAKGTRDRATPHELCLQLVLLAHFSAVGSKRSSALRGGLNRCFTGTKVCLGAHVSVLITNTRSVGRGRMLTRIRGPPSTSIIFLPCKISPQEIKKWIALIFSPFTAQLPRGKSIYIRYYSPLLLFRKRVSVIFSVYRTRKMVYFRKVSKTSKFLMD